MSELYAVEEKESSMAGLLKAVREEFLFVFRSLQLRLTPRITILNDRLQTDCAEGNDISAFQERFNLFAKRYNICVPVTGVYDAVTRAGVATFQREVLYVLDSDGFVGPVTARKLHIKLLGE